MNESLTNRIINRWELHFYTEPILILLQFSIIILYLKNEKYNKLLRPFLYYTIAGILLFLLDEIIQFLLKDFLFLRFIITDIFKAIFTFIYISTIYFFYIFILST